MGKWVDILHLALRWGKKSLWEDIKVVEKVIVEGKDKDKYKSESRSIKKKDFSGQDFII